ncbi:MAG: hypothetical protein QMD53_03010 [Actinomycetota bacterium]|nr:hypothetical protein [Actinomycetota bacterium]
MDGLWQKYGDRVEFRIFDGSAGEGEDEARQFNVTFLPTFVLLRTDGTIQDIGYIAGEDLEKKLLELLD